MQEQSSVYERRCTDALVLIFFSVNTTEDTATVLNSMTVCLAREQGNGDAHREDIFGGGRNRQGKSCVD